MSDWGYHYFIYVCYLGNNFLSDGVSIIAIYVRFCPATLKTVVGKLCLEYQQFLLLEMLYFLHWLFLEIVVHVHTVYV